MVTEATVPVLDRPSAPVLRDIVPQLAHWLSDLEEGARSRIVELQATVAVYQDIYKKAHSAHSQAQRERADLAWQLESRVNREVSRMSWDNENDSMRYQEDLVEECLGRLEVARDGLRDSSQRELLAREALNGYLEDRSRMEVAQLLRHLGDTLGQLRSV